MTCERNTYTSWTRTQSFRLQVVLRRVSEVSHCRTYKTAIWTRCDVVPTQHQLHRPLNCTVGKARCTARERVTQLAMLWTLLDRDFRLGTGFERNRVITFLKYAAGR